MTRYFHPQYRSTRYLKPAYVLVSKEFLRLAVSVAFIIGLFLIYGHLLRVHDAPRAAVTWEARP